MNCSCETKCNCSKNNASGQQSCACEHCNCIYIASQIDSGRVVKTVVLLRQDEKVSERRQKEMEMKAKVEFMEFEGLKSISLSSLNGPHGNVYADFVFNSLSPSQEALFVQMLKKLGYSLIDPYPVDLTRSPDTFVTAGDVSDNEDIEILHSSFLIEGMSCSSCVFAIQTKISELDGVIGDSVVVTLLPPRLVLDHSIPTFKVLERLEELGFEGQVISSRLKGKAMENVVKIMVGSMTCSSCVKSIEDYLMSQIGITKVSVNLLGNFAMITHDPAFVGIR
jgi:copper chaperone CopZ